MGVYFALSLAIIVAWEFSFYSYFDIQLCCEQSYDNQFAAQNSSTLNYVQFITHA